MFNQRSHDDGAGVLPLLPDTQLAARQKVSQKEREREREKERERD
jgi:hypothetical protein